MSSEALVASSNKQLQAEGLNLLLDWKVLHFTFDTGVFDAEDGRVFCAFNGTVNRGEESDPIPFRVKLLVPSGTERSELMGIKFFLRDSEVDLPEGGIPEELLRIFAQKAEDLKEQEWGAYNVECAKARLQNLGKEVVADGLETLKFTVDQARANLKEEALEQQGMEDLASQRVEKARIDLDSARKALGIQQENLIIETEELGKAGLEKGEQEHELKSVANDAVDGMAAVEPLIAEAEKLVEDLGNLADRLENAESEGVRLETTAKLLEEREQFLPKEIKEIEDNIIPILDNNKRLDEKITTLRGPTQENPGLLERFKNLLRSSKREGRPLGEIADVQREIGKLKVTEKNVLDKSPEGNNDFASAVHGLQDWVVSTLNSPMGRAALAITVLGMSAAAGYGIKMFMGE